MKRLTAIVLVLIAGVFQTQALEITRYVSADGTGDGRTPETPTSSLQSVLEMGEKVDLLKVYVTPGSYKVYGSFSNIWMVGIAKLSALDSYCDINLMEIDPTFRPVLVGKSGFTNSEIFFVDVDGAISVNSGTLCNCYMTKPFFCNAAGGGISMYQVYGPGGTISSYDGVGIDIRDCLFMESEGVGLTLKGVYGTVNSCSFTANSGGGVHIGGSKGEISFIECKFSYNGGIGGLNSMFLGHPVNFINCIFKNNNSSSRYGASGVNVCESRFTNCIFDSNGTREIYTLPALNATSTDLIVSHCAFINNSAGLCYSGGAPQYPQITNTVFWNNGDQEIYCPEGYYNEPYVSGCAMTGGTGIPELDEERGLLILSREMNGTDPSQKYFAFDLENYTLQENSALINAGINYEVERRDFYYNSRNFFGIEDIGPVEYIGHPAASSHAPYKLTIDGGDLYFGLATTEYQNKKYNILYNVGDEAVESGNPLPKLEFLTFAGFGDKEITQYDKNFFATVPYGSGYALEILEFNKTLPLDVKEKYEYTSTSKAPTVRKAQKPNTVIITADGKNNYFTY